MTQKKNKVGLLFLLLLSFAPILFPVGAPSKTLQTVQAAPNSKQNTKPARVKRLRIRLNGKKTTLSWKAVSSAKGYEIWRSASKKGGYKRLKRLKKTRISVSLKKPYYYKVRAYKKSGKKIVKGKFSKTVLIAPKSVSPHIHTFRDWIESTSATCTTQGQKIRTCIVCEMSETEIIPALGHDIKSHVGKAATCTQDGQEDYVTCSRCDYTTYRPIPAPGHSEVVDAAVPASCTQTGLTSGSHCGVCGVVLIPQESIPSPAHDFGEWMPKNGYSERSCSICGKTELQTDGEISGHLVVFQSSDTVMGTLVGESLQTVEEYAETSQVTAIPNLGYEFDHWSNGSTNPSITVSVTENTIFTAYFRIKELELPIIRIETDNHEEVVEKELYLPCSVTISNTETAYMFENRRGKIRGRGNSTWNFDKKPYKLKFESKTDLFGNGAAKTWTLIANYYDRSLIRNELAYKVGAQFDYIKDTTTTVQSAELYFNGVYQGVYLICEQNEVGKTRVNIEDALTPVAADTGYLLELNDSFTLEDDGIEGRDWFRINTLPYVIKSPDFDKVTDESEIYKYVDYIKGYMQECDNALTSKNYASVQQFIDVNTFADSYILNELFKSVDVGVSSFFLYKDVNGKLCSGPVWDYDVTCGNWDFSDSRYSNVLWAKESNYWYAELLKYDEFVQLVSQRLENYKERIINTINESIAGLSSYENSFLRNFERWNIMGQTIWYEPTEIRDILTWQGQVAYVKNWLEESLDYMLSVY